MRVYPISAAEYIDGRIVVFWPSMNADMRLCDSNYAGDTLGSKLVEGFSDNSSPL